MVFDYTSAHNYAVLLMGGKGLRLNSETPKQYMMVAGQELFLYAAKTLSETRQIDFIIYVVPARCKEKTEKNTLPLSPKGRLSYFVCIG